MANEAQGLSVSPDCSGPRIRLRRVCLRVGSSRHGHVCATYMTWSLSDCRQRTGQALAARTARVLPNYLLATYIIATAQDELASR